MPPSHPAEGGGDWRDQLAVLRNCLDDLRAAMRTGNWEALEQLVPVVDSAFKQLRAESTTTVRTPADAEALRQVALLTGELQDMAIARQQQIQPLLQAWQQAAKGNTPTP